jgi:putative hydroxymethylpyrimidine transport system substrate-binding protein
MNRPRLLIIAIICLLWPAMAAGQDREKLTVLLDWFVNPDHAPLFVAQEKGFFSKRGLDVELIAPSNPNDRPTWPSPTNTSTRCRSTRGCR